MVDVYEDFAGENALVSYQCMRLELFTDSQIIKALQYLSERDKLKVIRYIIKLMGNPYLFHPVFQTTDKKELKKLLQICEKNRAEFEQKTYAML